ncbi:succinate dehydrogenase / fumarate reductase flavoprotein subunit/L-aspartate oxidase/fumarate reductase (CoM/CoB) subunit A [Hydrogenispora ethanolica]|uniref:L-aspartate oxidase n=1 Tax=Hydrogenispora ethanolica TaxID=1082276 RepID=A0A4R1RU05_HYDET|nr:FAD-binding protein [Hydrogenispora ethanolica]TCL70038.1 succinate dehydrogenase / fumarate reductase flavoprotein subunit/L-aspartate oxidase/fumarate reductase (CoM/CoB) subunit A [Hydrogenispora ethanolica]
MEQPYRIIIVGSGLAGLSAAARLVEEGEKRIAVVSLGVGGSPYVAAMNAVVAPNPWGDTVAQHARDMLAAGYEINDRLLVEEMCQAVLRGVDLLMRWGVEFATEDGQPRRRHASGSRYPRSLCQTSGLLGEQIVAKLGAALAAAGVTFYSQTRCVQLLVADGSVYGIAVTDEAGSHCRELYAPAVIAAWGGCGNLFPESTYPGDIDGRGLAMAYEAGAGLIDLEFLEFEPMVLYWPAAARGEPCPTAMLGEGAHLLNHAGERFLLQQRPQGEAGSPKSLINQAIRKELAAGKGSPHGGVYVDLRHIPTTVLQGYPWFYNRIVQAGLNPARDLLEVGPMAHSHSGGLRVDSDYQTSVAGLFAVGEAMGGMHGACRMAGNAASQALASGILGAEGVLRRDFPPHHKACGGPAPAFQHRPELRRQLIPQVRQIVGEVLGAERHGSRLAEGERQLRDILKLLEAKPDTLARQSVLAAWLMVRGARLRCESRGSHCRSDYPSPSKDWQCSIELRRTADGVDQWRTIARA